MKKNAATHLRDAIENEILTGTVGPGEWLDEGSRANRFKLTQRPSEKLRQPYRSA